MSAKATVARSGAAFRYRRPTYVAAALMLASGWGFCSWLRASGTSWILNGLGVQTVLIPFVVLGGIWLAAVGILVKSLKVTSRNDILSAAVVPCLVLGAFLVFIGVPALELVQGTGGRGFALVDDLWRQIGGVILLAVIVVALYGPQQFFCSYSA